MALDLKTALRTGVPDVERSDGFFLQVLQRFFMKLAHIRSVASSRTRAGGMGTPMNFWLFGCSTSFISPVRTARRLLSRVSWYLRGMVGPRQHGVLSRTAPERKKRCPGTGDNGEGDAKK